MKVSVSEVCDVLVVVSIERKGHVPSESRFIMGEGKGRAGFVIKEGLYTEHLFYEGETHSYGIEFQAQK